MRKWDVKLPGGRRLVLESDEPGRELLAQGYTEFSLSEIHPPKPEASGGPQLLAVNISTAAQMCGVSRGTFSQIWMREPGFPVLRVGGLVRIPVAALQAWMEARAGA